MMCSIETTVKIDVLLKSLYSLRKGSIVSICYDAKQLKVILVKILI